MDAFAFGGPAEVKRPTHLEPDLLRKFVGTYEIFPGLLVHLTTENGKLYLRNHGDSAKMELPRTDKYEFDYPIFTHSKFIFGSSQDFRWRLFDMTYTGKRINFKPFDPKSANLKELVGTYYSPELKDEYNLNLRKGLLVATHRRNPDVVLTPIQRDWFQGNADFFAKVVPVRNTRGNVVGLKVSAQRALNVHFERVNGRPK